MEIKLDPKILFYKLSTIIVFFVSAHIIVLTFSYFDHKRLYGLSRLFNLDLERNLPTFFSTILLLMASLANFIIYIYKKNKSEKSLGWLILFIIFLFLSFDEIASIHEQTDPIVKGFIATSGIFYFAWVIPYTVMLILLAILYSRFILALPKKTKLLFILSGLIYVSGAIGIEMISAAVAERYGERLYYDILATIEETLEMIGVTVFIYSLLSYMKEHTQPLTITLNR